MLKAFFGAVFVALVLLGTLTLCYAIMLKALVPKKRYDYYVVIESDSCEKELSAAVYAAKTKINLLGDDGYGKILVLDKGMGDDERLGCLNICRQTNGIYLISAEQLKDLLA